MNSKPLSIKAFITGLTATSVSVFVLHFLINRLMNSGLESVKIIEMYVVLYILSMVHFFAIRWIFKKWAKYAGLLFTALSLLKMIVALLYLMPDIFPAHSNSVSIAINFMAVYLVLLFYEVLFLVKKLSRPNEG